jgi:hypothetical protein
VEKNEKWSELSEMARTLIKKCVKFLLGGQHLLGVKRVGEFRLLVCTDTGARTPPWRAPEFLLFDLLILGSSEQNLKFGSRDIAKTNMGHIEKLPYWRMTSMSRSQIGHIATKIPPPNQFLAYFNSISTLG